MQAYFWIAVGSALGGMARYWCTGAATRVFGETFPWGTLFVNILGSLIIGFFVALTGPEGRYIVDPNMRAFVSRRAVRGLHDILRLQSADYGAHAGGRVASGRRAISAARW